MVKIQMDVFNWYYNKMGFIMVSRFFPQLDCIVYFINDFYGNNIYLSNLAYQDFVLVMSL